MMKIEEASPMDGRDPKRLIHVLKYVKIYGHELSEHATVMFTRAELALEEVVEANHPLREHLTGIYISAKEVVTLSYKLRQLGSD